MLSSHLDLAKKYWKETLKPGDTAIDATCGNGFDTLFLSELLFPHPESCLIALDVQAQALQNTLDKLPLAYLSQIRLIQSCHSQIADIFFLKPPRLIVYNLGYLPKGDKTITTKVATTLRSIQSSLEILGEGGALSVMCYPGHEEGALEETAILDFLQKLDYRTWEICHHRYVNRQKAPSLIWMQKRFKSRLIYP